MSIFESTVKILHRLRLLSPPFHLRHWGRFRLVALLAADIAIIAAVYYGAFFLRLEAFDLEDHFDSFIATLPWVLVTHAVVFLFGGMYRQVWRYANFDSAMLILKCVVSATSFSVVINFLFFPDLLPPRSVPVIFGAMSFIIVSLSKFSWRAVSQQLTHAGDSKKEGCLIYGAGSAGDLLARHIEANPKFPYRPRGFIDDDKNKLMRTFHGLKVLGTGEDLPEIVESNQIKRVIIAINSSPGAVIRAVVERCQAAGVSPLIMPDLANVLGSDLIQPRPVQIRDLLRREVREPDREKLIAFIGGRTILVTGAGGSIGSEICRQVINCRPRQLILFDNSEINLYQIERELRRNCPADILIEPVVGSMSDKRCVTQVFRKYRPTHVIHAAAYKQVPLMEVNLTEAIVNNVRGTLNLATAAIEFECSHFLLISTDKAVRPTNVMGATKRCCELIISALWQQSDQSCNFCAVRFGNVLGSSGSVVPLFLEQIKEGGPVTVTHPDITRYFMLISEAVGLVLESSAISKGGETFILDMGEPIKILDMAEQLIFLAGKTPHKDIEISFVGLRPGEKLYEEIIKDDAEEHTVVDGVYVAIPKLKDPASVLTQVAQLISYSEQADQHACLDLLRSIGDLRREDHVQQESENLATPRLH